MFNKILRYSIIAIIFIFSGVISACDSDNEEGSLRVLLTDAPAFYDEVNIDIRKVMVNVHYEDNKILPWEVIFEGSMLVNLLDYQNGKTLELGEKKMKAVKYSQIRFIFGDESYLVVNGKTRELNPIEDHESGYKVYMETYVEKGKLSEVVVDFQVQKSISYHGEDSYSLSPYMRVIDLQNSSSIMGTVLPLEAKPLIHVEAMNADKFFSTQPDEDGDFKITGLDAGTYEVYVVPWSGAHANISFEGDDAIEVVEGEDFAFEEPIILEEQPDED